MTMLSQSTCEVKKPWPGIGLTPGGSVLKPQGQFSKQRVHSGAKLANAEAT